MLMDTFIKDGEYLYANYPLTEVYIPNSLFGDPTKSATIASVYGDGIRTLGMFNIRFFPNLSDKRDTIEVKTFNYPNVFETYPSEHFVEKLSINGVEDDYMVLQYHKGDIMMLSNMVQNTANCEFYMNFLISGKIPKSFMYTDLIIAWVKNFAINSVSPGVPLVNLQMILSEVCRDPNNPMSQFRKIAGLGNVPLNGFMAANMNQISSYSSVMSALSFERFNDKVASSITMTKDGTTQNKSPVEKVISY